MATYKEDTIEALKNLGGAAHLSKIMNEVSKLRKGNLNASWQDTVREVLYENTQDSKYGRGKYGSGENIFYSVRKKIFSIFGHDSIPKPDSITTHTSAHLEKFKSILKLSNKLTKENNSKLYFIYLPKYNRYIDGGNNGQLHSYNKIIKLVQSLDIPVIDINKKLFEKYDDPLSLFSFKMVHYTEKSNQLIAKIIFSKIQEYENIK